MTILEALVRLRNDIKLWVTNNLNTKMNKNLGVEESGNFLSVDSNGDVIPTNIEVSNVTNLQSSLDGKANTEHTHTMDQIDELQTTLNNALQYIESSVAQKTQVQIIKWEEND